MGEVHISRGWLRSPDRPQKRPRGSGARTSAFRLACLVAGAGLVLAACSNSSGTHSSEAPGAEGQGTLPMPTFRAPASRHARHASLSAVYTVRGNEILAADGRPFVPYGITVFGLSKPNWGSYVASDEAQIDATAQFWHGNMVRLQVAPPNLLASSPYSAPYLAAIDQQVAIAQEDGLDVILSAQYQYTTNIKMPDASTAQFWRLIAARFKSDPGVWFDLFNEPQFSGTPRFWDIWQDGGDGYVGMQNLVDTIRATGAQNVVLAEGLHGGDTLAGVPAHQLTGGNVVYAVHPYFRGAYWATPQAWAANWGDLTGTLPVVADEWGEYEQPGGTCVHGAPAVVPSFLSYLSEHNVGLVAWALVPGVLIRDGDLDDPTAFNPGVPWKCASGDFGPRSQGAGQSILAFFAARSEPVTATG
jgi:hypothetical protein